MDRVRFALRRLRHAPGLVAIVVVTLGLGIGVLTTVFSLVNTVVLRPPDYPEQGRIVTLWSYSRARANRYTASGPDFHDWRSQSRTLLDMAAYRGGETAAVVNGQALQVGAVEVSDGFFRALGAQPRSGRPWTAEEQRAGGVAVVGERFARRHFGADGRGALGATIKLAGEPLRIVGLMPVWVDFPLGTEIWKPFDAGPLAARDRGSHNWRVVARLAEGVTVAQARAELDGIAGRLARAHPGSNTGKEIALVTLHALLALRYQSTLWMLLGAAALLLLIACANVANLLLARGVARAHELAIRRALGASPGQIARELLAESLVLGLLGGGLGLVLAGWGLDAVLALAPPEVPRLEQAGLDLPTLGFAVAVSLLVCLLVGLFPVWQARSGALQSGLRAEGRGLTGGRGRLRAALVVAQLAVSLVLLSGAGLLLRSFQQLTRVDLGYRPENLVVLAALHPERAGDPSRHIHFFEELTRQAARLPGVEAASYTTSLPIDDIGSNGTYHIEGRGDLPPAERRRRHAVWRAVGPDYFSTIGVPLREGREIDRRDAASAPLAVVINETMARASWPGESPIGRRIRIGWDRPDWMTIVGVVAATRQGSVEVPPGQELFVPAAQHPGVGREKKLVARTAAAPLRLGPELERLARALDAEVPVQLTTAAGMVADSLAPSRFRGLLVGALAAIALVLCLVGVASVMARLVAERRAEVGVRLALGARPAQVAGHFLARAGRLTALGTLLGLAAALATGRLLEGLLFGVRAGEAWLLLGAGALLSLAALTAALWPALRAARTPPMTALQR